MKTKVCSFFVLFAIAAVMVSSTPAAFADHSEVTIEPVAGSGVSGCEDTADGCYSPSIATVDVGGKVIFSNTDIKSHTFTSFVDLSDTATVGSEFGEPGLLKTGESFEWFPDTVGEVKYFCMIHPWTQGLIIVQEAEEEVMEETVEEEVMEETVEEEVMEEEVVEEEVMMEETEAMEEEGGGCLIATAAFGSEMAPQVQQLRELRDNTILSTESGTSFMAGFNQLYYSFSPMIADLERESPVFKEVVKLTLTPMLSSLSLLNYVDINSEEEMLGYGISLILLNIGMYAGIPAFGILKLYQIRKN